MTEFSIRPATEDDKWMVLDWRNHPDVRAVMLTDHIIKREEHEAWWNKTMQMQHRQILIFSSKEKPVGVITIYAWDLASATAWWGFYLDNANLEQSEKTAVWLELEQAVIRYGRDELRLHKLFCESLKTNQLAWTLHKKCGFIECDAPNNATETVKDVVYMKYEYPENKVDKRAGLYLFASHNTDFLTEHLRKESNKYDQFPYQVKKVEFGRYQIELLDPSNYELNSKGSCYVFVERIEDLFSDIYTLPTEESLLKTEQRVAEYLLFIRQIATRSENRVYVADFCIQKGFPYSLEERESSSKILGLVFEWNKSLNALRTEGLIEILPYSQVIQNVGQSFANKYWYMARGPFSIQCLEAYSRSIIGTILASHSLSARALVLDLDNTLWKGIIGDDGKDGIELGGDYPGNIYKQLQSLFCALKKRGILLTICSKNTEEVALDAIESHPEMRLRKADFASYRINWNPKSQNIKELAQDLNLGVQSLCFIDDNPVERAEVRRNVPGVFVPELPEDPADWYEFICQLPELYVTQVSESDKRRAELYKKRADIQKAQSSFTDRSEFLASLKMDISVEPLNTSNFDRTYQLFNKTNQFNTTTTRYSKDQLKGWIDSDLYQVLHVRAKDKYSSEYEGIAALVIIREQDNWVIDNFVMSCRVMGRDIEKTILDQLIFSARKAHAGSITGRYVKSEKNMPVEHLFSNNNFERKNDEEWLFDMSKKTIPEKTTIMKVQWNV
ncbi:UDP-4-amino-4,6-dideoxy-N-acetyl-beta-L-altrosamine N-acetyltransferase [Vibrio vulnificus]|uniref:UDP-4-amino-4, 6-dideoxy-N-acetyl-beta-L-altrosamine N-acetyltransferase n=1 Tax=Vibrio vulnificus TaxID=672 RepID=UPI0019D498EB|nr:UDP-4-amino-4,6-dideoxy-N-acetyl-beta-L-altrosamine N-acetyltransferase [Vibrio vulnificus]MBN8091282.1 UDP-4-amino-4,6-dideoxy-N-acetyl-beta-L-altrosamine N-acetyltransferase [Vibrio vulnificus]HAS8443311.1 UDP-4-amino-4,6-dideoxy-N-acetyl-beta-L-altrosamine N-acetyltransferase [Vibrio vulnificus]HDY7896699.1 UDP-4-amino-4,6-dideoxy-N-acetyl-beta-L-altrosamine N-acetyltransferase [Vibrio vulnificus]